MAPQPKDEFQLICCGCVKVTLEVGVNLRLCVLVRIHTSMIKTRVEIELIFIGLITRILAQNRFVYITVQLNIVLGW